MKRESGGSSDNALNHVASGETLNGIHGASCLIRAKLSVEISRYGNAVHSHGGNGTS